MQSAADAREGGGQEEVRDARLKELWDERVFVASVVDLDPRMSFPKFAL